MLDGNVMLNPSTALARVLIDELIRGGVEEFVLAPGSRNAPLSIAIADEAARGRVRMHVRIDERTAGFLALGLAKGSGRAVAVVTTSGTATANLHPAVMEADHCDLPLIVLTADRPPELRATGANQTTRQDHLFGRSARHYAEIGPAEAIMGQVRYWRSAIARAVHASACGPVHLNIALREPLTGEDAPWVEPLDGRPGDLPWTMVIDQLPHTFEIGLDLPQRGAVVVAHDAAGLVPSQIEAFAHHYGWPVIAENPLSFPSAIAHAGLFLRNDKTRMALVPDVVVVVGRPVLNRSIAALIADAGRVVVVDPASTWSDPQRRADLVLPDLPMLDEDVSVDSLWLNRWREHSKRTSDLLVELPPWSSPAVTALIAEHLATPSTLFVGASNAIREIESFASPRQGVNVMANRGLAGIDGNVSTAVGIALTSMDPTFAVMGDLTFLHDINGLLIHDHMPALTLIVLDNNGGGIFSLLPQADSPHFETIFGTPHDRDLVAVASSFGVGATRVTSREDLVNHLNVGVTGLRVLVVDLPERQEGAKHINALISKI